jgi:hypothetical protein
MLYKRSGTPWVAGLGSLGLAITTIALLAGCSSSSAPSAASADAGVAAPMHAANGQAAKAAGAQAQAGSGQSAGGAGGFGQAGSAQAQSAQAGSAQSAAATRLAPTGAQLIYTAALTVRAKDVSGAVDRAASIVEAAGGYVSNENLTETPGQPDASTGTLQVKIPVSAYQATLDQLAGGQLGTRVSLQQQAQDATEQVADVNSQVASDEAAIAQLRALLTHAGSVSDLLDVQNQISTEESALESMQAQQKALDNETAFATVTLTVLSPAPVAPRPVVTRPPGLFAGLSGGWHAFRLSMSWLLAILGSVAPFAALIAVAGYLGYRARRWVLPRRVR